MTVNSISTADPAIVTLSATIAASRTGRKFMLDSDGIPHRIASHTGGQATLTLATVYTGDGTSGAGTIFQDEITVASDILAYPDIKPMHQGRTVELIGDKEFTERFLANRTSSAYGKRYATFITESKIRLHPWTTDRELFECAYNYRPSALDFGGGATDTPIVPQEHRVAIGLRALVRILTDKHERREQYAMVKAELDEALTNLRRSEATFAARRSYIPRGHRLTG